MKYKIEVERQENGWIVRYGPLWENQLTQGEALEVVARIILTGKAPYLKNDLQHYLWDLKYRQDTPRLIENPNG